MACLRSDNIPPTPSSYVPGSREGMCACVQPPPYMLGERPTPSRGGSGSLSFRQVPFVRVSERVESGIKVRKQLRKYLKTSATTQHLVAQMHLQDACVTAMQPQEVSQSCFESFFVQMKTYNQLVGQKHLEASKALVEMSRPLDNCGKSKKWARDAYNLVQKCVQDVALAEKKIDKARLRKERADDDLAHWKKVLEANEATYRVQPNNPEVQRAHQLAQYRFMNAFAEEEVATNEMDDARALFYASIERRDQVVEEATELSQSMEEDRMETMLIVMKQFVETKKAILQAEIEAISSMQRILSGMDKESVIQQYIVDAMQPELTHRQAKALYLLEWHHTWHHEQLTASANTPQDLLVLSPEDAAKLKSNAGLSANDVEVIKDFIVSCFIDPDRSILSGRLTSTKHRARFADPSAMSMYRIPIVRKIILQVLHHQRTHSLELSADGFFQLAACLHLVLDASAEGEGDAKTIKDVMNMSQTFYKMSDSGGEKEYLRAALLDHSAWNIPQYWGNALLLSIGEELSKNPQETAWYHVPAQERMQLVLHVHNLVFGQVSSFIANLESFGFSRGQIQQYVQNVCFAYEVSEDQRVALLQSVNSLAIDDAVPPRHDETGEEVQFTSLALPDWTYLCGGMYGGEKFRGFRSRTVSSSDARDSFASTTISSSGISLGGFSTAIGNGGIKDIEKMKARASAMITSSTNGTSTNAQESQESWQDLFGSAPPSEGAASTSMPDGEPKRNKTRKNSRKGIEPGAMPPPTPSHVDTEYADTPALPAFPPRASSTTSVSSRCSESGTRQMQSMDDTSAFLDEDKVVRRSLARHGKSRSVANIDTRGLNDGSAASFHVAQSPIVSLGASTTTAPTGMDHIKTIAAQMKKRREASGNLELSARASMSAAIPLHDAPPTTPAWQLRKTLSSRNMKDISGYENGKHTNGGGSTAAAPAAGERVAPPRDDSRLSGVAAMRARFEKK
jgi:hypothetical protein